MEAMVCVMAGNNRSLGWAAQRQAEEDAGRLWLYLPRHVVMQSDMHICQDCVFSLFPFRIEHDIPWLRNFSSYSHEHTSHWRYECAHPHTHHTCLIILPWYIKSEYDTHSKVSQMGFMIVVLHGHWLSVISSAYCHMSVCIIDAPLLHSAKSNVVHCNPPCVLFGYLAYERRNLKLLL